LKYFKYDIDVNELETYLEGTRPLIEGTVKEIKTRVGEVDDLNTIFIQPVQIFGLVD